MNTDVEYNVSENKCPTSSNQPAKTTTPLNTNFPINDQKSNALYVGDTILVLSNDVERHIMENSWVICLSWISCLFCCWPIGVAAIVTSYKSDQALSRGMIYDGIRLSEKARRLSYLAIVCGVTIFMVSGLCRFYIN